MNLSEVAPLFVVAGAVVTSVAAYRGVLLTTTTAVRTSASTRQYDALGELLGAVGKIQRSAPTDMAAAQREFRAAYELVQRTAPEPSDILGIADEMNDLVRAVVRGQLWAQTPLHVQILHDLRSHAAIDDEAMKSSGSLGYRHSREVLDEVVCLHAEQETALAAGRQAPDSARVRSSLLGAGWHEDVVDDFLACGALDRARMEEALSAALKEVGKSLSGLAAAKSRLIAAERSWVNNLVSPPARLRTVPRLLVWRRKGVRGPEEDPRTTTEPTA